MGAFSSNQCTHDMQTLTHASMLPCSTEALRADPPPVPDVSALVRTVLTDHPRVTRFPVDFDSDAMPGTGEQLQQDQPMDGLGLEEATDETVTVDQMITA